ncbi:chitosanase [Bradyrhizobium neotropicale]|uniref:chitosanase n=1 Tax=Bradyrhizobium neotropicale TaxID=1497615 RepID=UPI001AD6AB46|nr:chitosanase [Bradyrhizobium neotropicale]
MLNPVEESELQRAIDDLIKAALQLNDTARQLSQMKQSAPPIAGAVAATAAEAQAASTIQLTADQRLICERVINAFETGSMQGDYSNITIFPDGPNEIRQITYGRAQTTEYSHLRELVQMYVDAGGTFSNDLRPFLDRIGLVALVDDSNFKDLLRRAGRQDEVMRNTQDVFFDRAYFQPALSWAQLHGFSRALSVLVIYDSFIHSGGILGLLRSRFPEAVPARGGNEQTWISQYVSVRNDWLRNHPRPAVRASAYRTRDLLREIGRNNWDLSMLPISANGVQVDARPLPIHMAAAAGEPTGVPYFAQGVSQADDGVPDGDPAAPAPGGADDLSRGRDLANFGESGALDLSPLAAAAGVSPTLKLDMGRVRAFLKACVTSSPRVTYGLGKKVPFLGAVPGRDFTKVDCSGFVREALRLATTPPVAFPDGSVNQHDWVRNHGFAKSTVSAALQSDGLVRIAFLRQQDSPSHIGHVVLIAGARTIESHGGIGPDSRAWTGAGWQARTFVYVLAPDAAAVAAGGGAMIGGAMVQAAQPASFTVRTGRRYRATISLRGFEQFASNDMVAAELQRFGFIDVSVSGSGGTRQAEGTWSGPDTTAQLDERIQHVEEIAIPAVGQFA